MGSVSDGDGVGGSGSVNDGTERTHVSVLDVDADSLGGVIGTLPQVNVGVQRTSVGLEENSNLLDVGVSERPGSEGSSLHGDGGGGVPDLLGSLFLHGSATGSKESSVDASILGSGKILLGKLEGAVSTGNRGRGEGRSGSNEEEGGNCGELHGCVSMRTRKSDQSCGMD